MSHGPSQAQGLIGRETPDSLVQPAYLRAYGANPNQVFSGKRLVSYVAGLPRKPGWVYSNTNYVLAQMIIERVTHDSYADQLRRRIIIPLGLHNMFPGAPRYPRAVISRLPAGYYYISPQALPELSSQFATDQSRYTVSAPASGGSSAHPQTSRNGPGHCSRAVSCRESSSASWKVSSPPRRENPSSRFL